MKNDINNLPIGFFDSGVGGLSVYSKFKKKFPNENTIYYGDLKHLPYGNKTKEELIGYSRHILNFFKTKNIKAAVIACNTSSALAYETLKHEFDFSIFPIIQSSAKIIAQNNITRLGVFATVGTVKSGVYTEEFKKYNPNISVKEISCPDWVEIVEKGLLDSKNAYKNVEKHMKEMFEFKPQKIILGCTHYPYLIEQLKKFAPAETFIDPADTFVDYIGSHIVKNTNTVTGFDEFFVSSSPEEFVSNGKLFYDIKKLPEVC